MVTLTKTVSVHARSAKRVLPSTKKVWRALEVEFGLGQVEWIVSHTASIGFLPAGASVSAARLLSQADYSRNCGYLSGKAVISTPSYELLDADNDFSNLIASKFANVIGTYNKVIREYEWDQGTTIPLDDSGSPRFSAKGTWLFRDHSSTDFSTTVTINCADINRGLDQEIFNPLSWVMAPQTVDITYADGTTQADIDAGNASGEYVITKDLETFKTSIPVASFQDEPDEYWRPFEHGAHYHYQPSETGTYMLMEATGLNNQRKEIVWASDMRVEGDYVVIDVVRGQLNTIAQEIVIPQNTEVSKGPKLSEHIYFDETVTTMYRGIVSGAFDGRALPSHWSAYAGDEWVNIDAIAQFATELRLEFAAPEKTKTKNFLEESILAVMPAVAPINGRGELSYRPYDLATGNVSASWVFNESTCVTSKTYKLRHKKDEIYTSIRFEFDWDPLDKEFKNYVVYTSPESENFNGIQREKTFQFKGLRSGIHLDSQIEKLISFHGDAHFFEQQDIQIESFINDIPLGDSVLVNFSKPIAIDDANGSGQAKPVNRTFTVIAAKESRNTTVYTLRGTLQKASTFIKNFTISSLDVSTFSEGDAIDLAPMLATGTLNLVMGNTYYYLNDGVGLTVPSSVTVNVTGTSNRPLTILVDGPIDWTPNIDLTGKSARAAGQGSNGTTAPTDGEVGSVGGQSSSHGMLVERTVSYINQGTSDFGNDLSYYQARNSVTLTDTPVNAQPVGNTSVSGLNIKPVNLDGRLEGLPTNLAATSGAGGPRSTLSGYRTGSVETPNTVSTTYVDGGDGGLAGGAFVLVSQGGIMRGQVITSGTEGVTPPSESYAGQTNYGAKGGSGEPSPWIWILNNTLITPVVNEDNFKAILPTNDNILGTYRAGKSDVDPANPLCPRVTTNTAAAGTNLWYSRHQIITVGALQTLTSETFYTSSATEQAEQIIELLENQLDGEIELFISDVDPSNGNINDMVISQANLDSNAPKPPIRYLTADGWADFDWVNDSSANAAVFSALIYINRTYGASKILVSTTRPTEFDDGQVWFNPETDLSYILSSTGNDTIYNLGQIQTGNNVYRDGRFTLQREFNDQWVFLTDVMTLPTLFNGGTVGGTVSGSGQLPAPTLNAVAYNATTVGIFIGLPSDTNGITGYEIRRDGSLITTLSHAAAYFEDTGVTASNTYTYTARSVGSVGSTASVYASSVATTPASSGGGGGTPVLDPPASFTGTVYSTTSLELFWGTVVDTDVDGYLIHRNGVQLTIISDRNTGSFFQNTLTPNTTYIYEIWSRDNAGNLSATSRTLSLTTSAIVIDPPSNFVATASGQNTVNLSWTATTDTDATAYDVLRGGAVIASPSPRTANSYSDTGLNAGTQYNYSLRAKNGTGIFSGTLSASATTVSVPTLGTVSGFANTVYGPTSGELLWTPATDTNVTGYRVFRDGVLLATKSGRTTSSHYMNDMTASTTYVYGIRSIDAGGNESAELTTTMSTNS